MAHTHRDILNHRRRARWKTWTPSPLPAASDSDPINRYPRLRGGNMVMAPSVCGLWDDERPQRGGDRRQQRRNMKRRERQKFRAEVDALLAEQ